MLPFAQLTPDQQTPLPPPLSTPRGPHASGGLLGFLNAYNNPLARFTTGTTTTTTTTNEIKVTSTTNTETITKDATAPLPSPPLPIPGGLDAAASGSNAADRRRLYPVSTLLVVALIAFLIGSLLRSLLSPADFIYVVTDLGEAEKGTLKKGWREIRRLVEIKYLAGGWDLQVAVVRRH